MQFIRALVGHRLAGGVSVLAVTQFAASLMGLFRDRLLTGTFEPLVVDAYIASFRPSDLLFQTLIMSALGTVFVPMLASHFAHDRQQEAAKLLGSVLVFGGLLFGTIGLIVAIFFDSIAPWFTGFTGEALELYILFGRLALISNFLFVFGNAFGQDLIARERYWLYGLTPVLYTLGTICGILFLSDTYGALAPMVGTLMGAIVYVGLRFIGVLLSGDVPVPRLWHPDLRQMGILMVPRMLALFALQLQLLVFDGLASSLEGGSVTINAFARNFQAVLVGVIGIAVAQSLYSSLSQAAAKDNRSHFRKLYRIGSGLTLALTIPGAIVLSLSAPIAAWLVNLTDVLPIFAVALTVYAVSVPFESLNHLQLRAFYAQKNTVIPSSAFVTGGIVAIACSWILLPSLGVYALAAGYTLGEIAKASLLAMLIWRRWLK